MDFAVTARPWSDAMGRAPFRIDPLRNALVFARALRLLMIAAFAALLASPLLAADDTPRQTIEAVRSALADIDAALKSADLTASDLARLRAENDPLAARLQAVIADLTPRLEASRKRLAELKPAGKDTAATADSATDELKAEQAKHDTLDADLRSARALLLQTDEDAGRIGAMRRDHFAKQTFARSSSVLSPWLWTGLAREMPGNLATIGYILTDWTRGLQQRLTEGEALGFAALILALIAMTAPARWITRRVIARNPDATAPSRLKRALAASWTVIVLAGLPLAALGVVSYALDAFDISDPRMQPAFYGLLDGLRLIALANAFGRGLLAPGESNWRIYDLGNRASRLLFRFLIAAATIWGVERLVEAAADATASLNISIAARATAATLIALAAAATLRQIAHPAATPAPGRDPWAPARTLAWAFTVLLLGAALTGYIAFATFLIRQTFFVFATASVLFIVDTLIRESTEIFLKPDAAVGHGLMTMIGLRRETLEQVVVVVQGVARLAAVLAALLLAFGPFGLPSGDILATARAAYFGFTIGGLTISISSLIAAVVMFMVGLVATRAVQNWLSERYLPRTRLDAGVSNSIRTITGYVGVAIALLLGGARLGLDLQKFAIVAGALSVGIGFGLQSIANNFVSGLILLWERGIRVGDWVVVGANRVSCAASTRARPRSRPSTARP